MKSVMSHQFSQVPRADIPRSSFNRSHGLKTTFDADWLVPIMIDDVIPGDSYNVNCSFFARLATPLYPIMDNMYLDTFFFFVPYRLLWTNWERFCGAQDDPNDSISFTIPVGTASGYNITTADAIYDYMGMPWVAATDMRNISMLPFRAYNLIYNDWFRDENLQNSLTVDTDNGPDAESQYELKKRGKRHDYFTSCLPWPQKGTAVSMPLGTSAPILGLAIDDTMNAGDAPAGKKSDSEGAWSHYYGPTSANATYLEADDPGAAYHLVRADLSNALAPSINDIRLAFQTQRLLERDARSGTRYVEHLLAHFGVTSPDFRLQRPEFLGGGSTPINVNPVAQTSGQPTPVADDKLGNLAAIGTAAGTHGFTKSFVEHGVIIGLANVRADLTYSQGLERYWFKQTRLEFFYPVLAQIGEQSVLQQEIWVTSGDTAANLLVFGYQERYAEYRYKPSRLTGLFRVDHASTLAAWHLSEDFGTAPTLGDTFIQSNAGVPIDRAIAINTEPHFIADFYFNMKCARPMPLYGVPGNLDRF